MKDPRKTVGANVALGLLGVLLVGIEIGKNAQAGDSTGAYTLALAAVSALVSGNVGAVLNLLPAVKKIFSSNKSGSSEPE
jgi:hypothetical protein